MPIGPNGPDYTDLDYPQVLQRVFEESEDRLRVDAEITAVIGVVEVVITDTNDSIKIGNGLGVFADVDAGRNLTVIDVAANTTLSSIDSQLSAGITVNAVQSGVWSTGRTWVLDNSTDSVESFQGGLWDVSVNNFPTTQSVTQGTSPWVVSGTVAATQSGIWTTGRTWVLDDSTDSVTAIQGTTPWIVDGSGFTQPVSGTITALQGTSPWVVSGTITTSPDVNVHDGTGVSISSTGSSLDVNVTNTIPVSQSGAWTVAATQSGAWTIGRTWTLSSGTDSVSSVQSGAWTVTVLQGTSPWVISGTVTTTNSDDHNYGVVGANTLRTAAQIGNATGAADFNAGITTAQTLRVVLPTDQTAIPVTQSGVWTTGRTWTLSSGTDSVNIGNFPATVAVTQSTSPWVVSGTVTVNQGTSPWVISGAVTLPYDTNYGTVGANTLRTASQIGNATGAADFNAGVTGAQTLRTTSNITRNGTELNYNYGTVGANTLRTASQIGNATGAADFNTGTTTAQTLRVSEAGFATPDNTRPSVTNVSSTVLAANANRKYANIFNQSGSTIFFKFGATSVVNEGIRLTNNSMLEINGDGLWLGTVTAIKSGAAAAVLDIFEGTP